MSRERLERCFHLCAQRAWRMACVMLGDPHGAADCVQQAFVAATRKPDRIPQDDPWLWFSTVVFHEIRNLRRKHRPGLATEELDMPDPHPDPARQAQQAETSDELRLALQTLPEAERDAITLTYITGLTHVQAAQTLDMPAKTLSSHVIRGLERLRRRLNHKEEALLSSLTALPLLTPPGGWDGALAAWQGAVLGSALPGAVAIVGGTIMAKKAMVVAGLALALCVGGGLGVVADRQWLAPEVHDIQQSAEAGKPGLIPAEPTQGNGGSAADGQTRSSDEGADNNGETRGSADRVVEVPTPEDAAVHAIGLQAWLASFRSPGPEVGKGRIFGRARQADGAPMAGVTVTAIATFSETWSPRLEEEPLEKQIERLVRNARFASQGTHTTRTDEQGRYEIGGLGGYAFRMRAELPGFTFKMTGQVEMVTRARPDAEIDFEGQPALEIEADVRLPDGSQPDYAMINLGKGESHYSGFEWSPRRTIAQFGDPLGDLVWVTTTTRNQGYASVRNTIDLKRLSGPTKMKFELHPVATINCTVKIPAHLRRGSGGMRFSVHLDHNPPPGEPTKADLKRLLPAGSPTFEPAMSFPNLRAGRYRLILSAEAERVLAWKDVELGLQPVSVELTPPEPDVKDYIVVRVFSHEGKTIPKPNLQVMLRWKGGGQGIFFDSLAMSDDSVWIRRVPAANEYLEGVTDWNYEISVYTPGHGSKLLNYAQNDTSELEFRMDQPAAVTIKLQGLETHPLKDRIRATLSVMEGGWRDVGYPDDKWEMKNDSIRYSGLNAGKCKLTLKLAHKPEDKWAVLTFAETAFEITAGENTQTISVPALFKVTLIVPDHRTLDALRFSRPDWTFQRSFEGGRLKERIEVEGITAGDWMISTATGQSRISVISDMEHRLDLRPFDCIALGGIKPGGKLEAMGLRNEDRVIQIDGQGLGDASALMKLFDEAMLKEQSAWTIVRQGAQVAVNVSGIEISKLKLLDEPARETLSARKTMRE